VRAHVYKSGVACRVRPRTCTARISRTGAYHPKWNIHTIPVVRCYFNFIRAHAPIRQISLWIVIVRNSYRPNTSINMYECTVAYIGVRASGLQTPSPRNVLKNLKNILNVCYILMLLYAYLEFASNVSNLFGTFCKRDVDDK
jgi:hypothetical protein